MAKEHPVVVIDNGSYECKVGIVGAYDHPEYCFRTVVGRANPYGNMVLTIRKKVYISDEAL